MTQINVFVSPENTAVATLESLLLTATDKALLLGKIGASLAENTRLRFVTQTGPDGVAWKKSWRASRQDGQTLRDTGVLAASIAYRVNGDSVEIGSNVAYAPWLHFGATIKPKNKPFLRFKIKGFGWFAKKEVTLPARPIFGFDKEDVLSISDEITDFLVSR